MQMTEEITRESLEAMDWNELRAIAKDFDVKTGHRKRHEIEDDILRKGDAELPQSERTIPLEVETESAEAKRARLLKELSQIPGAERTLVGPNYWEMPANRIRSLCQQAQIIRPGASVEELIGILQQRDADRGLQPAPRYSREQTTAGMTGGAGRVRWEEYTADCIHVLDDQDNVLVKCLRKHIRADRTIIYLNHRANAELICEMFNALGGA